jgi:hypothetical protein
MQFVVVIWWLRELASFVRLEVVNFNDPTNSLYGMTSERNFIITYSLDCFISTCYLPDISIKAARQTNLPNLKTFLKNHD